jgi:uncharacterized protein YjbI with pentapeptide repeats
VIEIKRWTDGTVLYTAENAQDVRQALREAVEADILLQHADLRDLDLTDLELDGGRFVGSRFVGSRFVGSRFVGSRFDGSSFDGSSFVGSRFVGSRFVGSSFVGSRFVGSRFVGSSFVGSRFVGSRFDGSSFVGSRFVGSRFDGSSFDGSSFVGSSFDGSSFVGSRFVGSRFVGSRFVGSRFVGSSFDGSTDNPGHPFYGIRLDVWAILDAAPGEVAALREKMLAGEIDGSVYQGECACLCGTIANAQGVPYTDLEGITPDAERPAERWFGPIRRGDKPTDNLDADDITDGVYALTIALRWVDQWLESRLRIAEMLGRPEAA